tara:strand:- start:611 stop:991 length:381 start_codon:yes stop_codon:yes gene_type:complete
MIQVGTNRFRRETWEAMKDICAIEGTRLADEIWAALDMHVKTYAMSQKNALVGDGRVMMDRPIDTAPEGHGNVFDEVVDKIVRDAEEELAEEVVDAEREDTGRTDNGRMADSNMFGHYKPSDKRVW